MISTSFFLILELLERDQFCVLQSIVESLGWKPLDTDFHKKNEMQLYLYK